jgi:hypothetical protein
VSQRAHLLGGDRLVLGSAGAVPSGPRAAHQCSYTLTKANSSFIKGYEIVSYDFSHIQHDGKKWFLVAWFDTGCRERRRKATDPG